MWWQRLLSHEQTLQHLWHLNSHRHFQRKPTIHRYKLGLESMYRMQQNLLIFPRDLWPDFHKKPCDSVEIFIDTWLTFFWDSWTDLHRRQCDSVQILIYTWILFSWDKCTIYIGSNVILLKFPLKLGLFFVRIIDQPSLETMLSCWNSSIHLDYFLWDLWTDLHRKQCDSVQIPIYTWIFFSWDLLTIYIGSNVILLKFP